MLGEWVRSEVHFHPGPHLFDVHCHLYEFKNLEEFVGIKIVAVSDDLESSIKTIKICKKTEWIPAVGIHPWGVKRDREIG